VREQCRGHLSIRNGSAPQAGWRADAQKTASAASLAIPRDYYGTFYGKVVPRAFIEQAEHLESVATSENR
jgi:hypothetical protein